MSAALLQYQIRGALDAAQAPPCRRSIQRPEPHPRPGWTRSRSRIRIEWPGCAQLARDRERAVAGFSSSKTMLASMGIWRIWVCLRREQCPQPRDLVGGIAREHSRPLSVLRKTGDPVIERTGCILGKRKSRPSALNSPWLNGDRGFTLQVEQQIPQRSRCRIAKHCSLPFAPKSAGSVPSFPGPWAPVAIGQPVEPAASHKPQRISVTSATTVPSKRVVRLPGPCSARSARRRCRKRDLGLLGINGEFHDGRSQRQHSRGERSQGWPNEKGMSVS
jgi:hypothetical protein